MPRKTLLLLVLTYTAAAQTWENLNRSIVKVLNPKNEVVGAGLVVGISDGTVYILTARHVVDDAVSPSVVFYEQQTDPFPATPGPRTDTATDLAMLLASRSITGKPAPTALTKFIVGDLSRIAVNEKVTAIGHPLRETWLPALNNEILATDYQGDLRKFRFKNAATDAGNSGGPIFLADGSLIGIMQGWSPLYAIGFRISDARQLILDLAPTCELSAG